MKSIVETDADLCEEYEYDEFCVPVFPIFFFFFLNIGLDFDIKFVSLRVSSLVAITKDFIEGNYLNHKVAGISLLSIILNISDDGTSVKE